MISINKQMNKPCFLIQVVTMKHIIKKVTRKRYQVLGNSMIEDLTNGKISAVQRYLWLWGYWFGHLQHTQVSHANISFRASTLCQRDLPLIPVRKKGVNEKFLGNACSFSPFLLGKMLYLREAVKLVKHLPQRNGTTQNSLQTCIVLLNTSCNKKN